MGALGYVILGSGRGKYLNTQKELEAMLVGYLVADVLLKRSFLTAVTTGASMILGQATKVARAMITQYGMSKEVWSDGSCNSGKSVSEWSCSAYIAE